MAIPLAYMAVNNKLADVADKTEVVIWENADQLKAYVAGEQGDFVTMPSNNSAIFYNKGLKLQLLDISVWNITYLITTDPDVASFADIKGQSLAVPFQGSVPDLMFQYIAKAEGLDPQKDFKLRYATDPTQAAQLLLSGQVQNAVLSEALATAVVLQTKDTAKPLHRALAFDKAWGDASGGRTAPSPARWPPRRCSTGPTSSRPSSASTRRPSSGCWTTRKRPAQLVETQLPQLGLKAAVMTASLKNITWRYTPAVDARPEPGGLLPGSVGALAGSDRGQGARRWLLLQPHPLVRREWAAGAADCSTPLREWLPSSSDGSCSRCSSTRSSWPRRPTRSGPSRDLAWGSTLWIQLLITLKRLVIGLAVGAAAGWVLGVAAGLEPRLRAFLEPLRWVGMTIPVVIIAGLAMLWFGLGDFTVIFVVALIVTPTMYVNTVEGVLAIDRNLVEMGRVYRFPRGLLLREIYLPGIASPAIAGLTLATGIGGAGGGPGRGPRGGQRHRPRFRPGEQPARDRAGLRLGPGAARAHGGHRVRRAAAGQAAGHALAEGPAMIAFEHVSKSFDSLKVLNDLSFRISSGQILGVVGPSGVGKTTILKLITGILAPDAGSVTVADGALGYVFQEPRLLPWRTALDNVASALRAQGMDKAEARERAAGWLEKVGLEGFEHYHPAELSGGMAQRVSVARALSVEPAILLMDEPFSNMDATLKASLVVTLQEILRERRTTVVYVTHDLTEALQLADRIVELMPDKTLRELDLSDRRPSPGDWLAKFHPLV